MVLRQKIKEFATLNSKAVKAAIGNFQKTVAKERDLYLTKGRKANGLSWPRTLFFLAILLPLGALSVWGIKEVIKVNESKEKMPLSPITRTSYHKGELKHVHLSDFQIPVYLEKGRSKIQTLRMGFTLETSNRYLKKYIEENEYQFRGHIILTFLPMAQKFVLSPEGLEIIKGKIKFELNGLIKNKGIEGKILKVNINSIVAS